MTLFQAVKHSVTTRQAAEYYQLRVNRAGLIVCPFHSDRTPSMKVDARFHCFGCGADGDVIDFTAQLHGLDVKAAAENRRSTESFELVLSKAQSVYDEIVAAADVRAEEIVAKANEEAAHVRETAQSQISDLTEKLSALRKETSEYYASVKKAVDAQAAAMEQIKKLL